MQTQCFVKIIYSRFKSNGNKKNTMGRVPATADEKKRNVREKMGGKWFLCDLLK